MSRPFHSRITRQNQSKNERATPKDPKIPFLGLDAKGHKNRKIRNSPYLPKVRGAEEPGSSDGAPAADLGIRYILG